MGLLWTLLLFAPLALGAHRLAVLRLGRDAGLERVLAAIVIAWSWLTLGLQTLGIAGQLNRPALVLWSVTGLGLALLAGWVWTGPRPGEPAAVAEHECDSAGWSVPATIAVGLALWACLVIGIPSLMLPVKVVSDGPIYHLHFAARWWQEGRLSLIASPFGETAAAYFPANGDLWFAGLMVGWGGDRLARVGQAPFLLASALAVYALARRLGAGRSAAVLATTWFVTSTPILLFSFEPNVDTIFMAGYLLAVVFLARYALEDAELVNLILAGLAAGASWGCKPTATVFQPTLLLVGAAVILRRPGGRGLRLGHLAGFLLASGALAAYWFGRNFWLTGNPIYPAHLSVLGRTVLAGWFPTEAMSRSQFYIPRAAWPALLDILITVLDPRELLFWIAAALGLGAVRSPSPAVRRWLWLCRGLAVANIALYWLVIPYRTQQRFMVQALGLLVPPLAALIGDRRPLQWAAAAILAVHLTTGQGWPVPIQVTGLIPAPPLGAVSLPYTLEQWRVTLSRDATSAYLAAKVLGGLAALAVAWLWARAVRRPSRMTVGLGLLATGAVVGLAIVAVERGLGGTRPRFPGFPEYYRAWNVLDQTCPPTGSRIAYAGTNLPYYLMGSDLRNWVGYVNIDANPHWLMHDYHRSAAGRGEPVLWDTPRPGWDRIRPDREAWLANLEAAGIEWLVVARVNPVDGPFNLVAGDPEQFPIERRWAEERPDRFVPLYGSNPPDPQMRIYRVIPSKKSARIAAPAATNTP